MAKPSPMRADSRALISANNRHFAETGTAFANYSYTPSCEVAFDLANVPSLWGGARNRADRLSWHLSERQVYGMVAAASHAEKSGLSFNRHWVVHYERAGIADSDGARFIGHLLRLVSAYARRSGGVAAAIWAREGGEGKGGHVHILLHLATTLSLRGRTRRWIVAAGGKMHRGVSKVRSIGGRLRNVEAGDEHRLKNTGHVLAYLMKGASRETGLAMGLPRYGEGGPIIGKRAGWTQNLGLAAQRRAGG